MTTKITIDPALVNQVLGIEEGAILSIGETIYYKDMQKIDIHRFKDMAIEWCAGKGWQFRVEIWNKNSGYIGICNEDDRRWRFNFPKEHSDKLSAELAAVSFVWEQIQKEEENEDNTNNINR